MEPVENRISQYSGDETSDQRLGHKSERSKLTSDSHATNGVAARRMSRPDLEKPS
jgi:hypothetical protein